MMKRCQTLLYLLLFLTLPALCLVCGFLLPPRYEETFMGELKEKVRLLDETPSPRLILVGGSGAAFGVDSCLLEEALPDYHVVNFGMYAALGTSAMLDLSKSRVREGDLVILLPEESPQTFSDFFDPDILWQGLDGAFSLLSDLPAEKQEHHERNDDDFRKSKSEHRFKD